MPRPSKKPTSPPRGGPPGARQRWRDGSSLGAIAGWVALLVDSAIFYFSRLAWPEHPDSLPASPAWLLLVYTGVAAPWAILLSQWCAGLMWSLGAGVYRAPHWLWRVLWSRDADLPQRTAFVIVVATASSAFAVASWFMGLALLTRVRTTGLALALLPLLQIALVMVLAASAASWHRGLHRLLSWAPMRRLDPWLAPGVLVFLGALACAAGGYPLLDGVVDLEALPWTFLFAPLAGVLCGGFVLGWLRGRRFPPLLAFGPLLSLLLLAALPLYWVAPSTLSFIRTQPGLASAWRATAARLLDFDADGSLGVYGEGDCAPLDGSVHPLAREIPNNGVDEDCSGRDLKVEPGATLRQGRLDYPRPDAVVRRPHIVLVTTDGLSYSRTSLGGGRHPTTPHLGAWAQRATTFGRAFSLTPSTYGSLPALLTGAYPTEVSTARVKDGFAVPAFRDDAATLAAMLARLGYATVAILPNPSYFGDRSWKNLGAGFQVVDFGPAEAARQRESGARKVHSAPELTARAIQLIAAAQAPLFLWIHYFDHHQPYEPNPAWGELARSAGSAAERFDAEVEFADRHWGALFDAIESQWEPREYIAVFTADHGEAFDGNHARSRHNFSLYSSELHIPFVIQAAGGRGKVYDSLTGSLDLVPTIAGLVPLRSKHPWRGESLVGALFYDEPPTKSFVPSVMLDMRQRAYSRPVIQRVGIRTDDWYLVQEFDRGRRWLTRWREDPLENRDLSGTHPDQVERLGATLRREVQTLRRTLP